MEAHSKEIPKDSHATALRYTGDEQEFACSIVARLNEEAKYNVPTVKMEINSYTIKRLGTDVVLDLLGDMTYNENNQPLMIKVSIARNDAEEILKDVVLEYIGAISEAFGMKPFEGLSIYEMAQRVNRY